MIPALLFAVILLEQADAKVPPEHVQKYLQRCEQAKSAAIKAQENAIKALRDDRNPTKAALAKLPMAEAELQRLGEQPAPLVPLPLPPEKEDIGIFVPASAADSRGGKSVDVLEVVDENDAIIRAWYFPPAASPGNVIAAEDPTFVDLWLHGIDTSTLAAGSAAKLPQVFHVTGNKLFDTTCGKRSLPLLEPIDIDSYRKSSDK
jgi:hypothetical protein